MQEGEQLVAPVPESCKKKRVRQEAKEEKEGGGGGREEDEEGQKAEAGETARRRWLDCKKEVDWSEEGQIVRRSMSDCERKETNSKKKIRLQAAG